MSAALTHRPVLLEETLTALRVIPHGRYVDGTFGRGGHCQAILDQLNQDGEVLAFDRDPEAVLRAETLAAEDGRLRVVHGSFTTMPEQVAALGWSGVDGVLLDLGVSSPQLDDAQRGFSFQADGPLDMRMDNSSGQTAAQWLASVEQDELVQVLREFGEERFAKRIARAICDQRDTAPIESTAQLAKIVSDAMPFREPGKHPATRSFQAIRIAVNRELDAVDVGLQAAMKVLRPGGRLAVISFHSLEDRRVKRYFQREAKGDDFPPGVPVRADQLHPRLRTIGRQQRAGQAELSANPRARSAVLRVAERV